MSERRVTRASTRTQTEKLEKELKEREEKARASANKRQNMAESRRLAKEKNLDKLKKFFKLKLSAEEKEEYTKDFTQVYMWEYKVWRDYLLENIEKDDLNAVLFWLNKVTEFSSIERRIDEDVYYFMTELLDKMRDMKREYLFWDRPYFNQLKNVLKSETDWWYNHLYDSLDQPNYIKKLMDHSWKVISWKLIEHIVRYKKTNQILINYMINYIYTKDDLSEYHFNSYKFYIVSNILLEDLKRDGLTTTQKDNIRYYLNYLILKRGKSLPPLTVDMTQTTAGVPIYVFDKGLYPFLIKCLEMNETSILESFIKAFDIKRIENDTWFKFLFEIIIRAKTLRDWGYISADVKIEDIKRLVTYILKAYKINLNNVYMNQKDLFKGEQPDDPIRNPKIWIDKNMPVIAWAVLYKNKDAIDYLLDNGAKLNRCAIAIQDLTDEPAILGRFNRERKAVKIQRAFTEHLYSPSHPSQQRRATAFKEKYQTAQSIPPIQEEQTGGKKKLKKRA